MPVEWQEITAEDFETLPEPTHLKPVDPEWEELLTALEAGRTVRIPFGDDTEKRGRRLALGRRSKGRGFRVDIRYGEGFMAARRRDEAGEEQPAQAAAAKPKPANGRRKRTAPDGLQG